MKVFRQNKHCPSQVLFAFDEVANADVEEIKFAVAYSTYRGCQRLVDRISTQIGQAQWEATNKLFITSLDFGLTDPTALEFLSQLNNSTVYIANPAVVDNGGFMPSNAFHPKIYLFNSYAETGYVLGSANLTESALISNSEIVVAGKEVPENIGWDDVWTNALSDSELLCTTLLNTYRERRTRPKRRPVDPDPDIPTPTTQPGENPVFWDAITTGDVDPTTYNHFWIEAGSMSSGGSRNQLELPRGANQFFRFAHSDYEDDHITIGHPTLTIREQSWNDRPLTWHGNNRMERINLPTVHQGGFEYQNTAVLFRRHENGFEIKIAPWNDANAMAWRSASESLNTVFRLGTRGQRICGFF